MSVDLVSVLAPRLMERGLPGLSAPPPVLPLLGMGADALRPGAGPPTTSAAGTDTDPVDVLNAARQLEGFFLTMLLQEMRAPHLFDEDDDGLFVQSREERIFLQQLDQALGDELARTGQLGLADVIVQQLLPAEPSVKT